MSVYFAKVGGYVKVGYSTNAKRRMMQIKHTPGSKPADLDRQAKVDALHVVEGASRRHERFALFCLRSYRAAGEWFDDCATVREFIALGIVDRIVLDPPEGNWWREEYVAWRQHEAGVA